MRCLMIVAVSGALASFPLFGQEPPPAPAPPAAPVTLEPGTRLPLTLINSVSTKHSAVGDRVYLQTAFPISSGGRIVVPPGSYVLGTVTELKRPGRVKGKGELFLRFDSLTLPNGVVRDFRARLSNVDAASDEKIEHKEGKVKGDGNVGGDLKTVGEVAAAGAGLGAIVGAASQHAGMGAGIGAGAGAAAGLLGVLLTRGPDAVLAQGSTVEMVLDRQLTFDPSELNFGPLQPIRVSGPIVEPSRTRDSQRSRLPF
jgi:hypothetical protein